MICALTHDDPVNDCRGREWTGASFSFLSSGDCPCGDRHDAGSGASPTPAQRARIFVRSRRVRAGTELAGAQTEGPSARHDGVDHCVGSPARPWSSRNRAPGRARPATASTRRRTGRSAPAGSCDRGPHRQPRSSMRSNTRATTGPSSARCRRRGCGRRRRRPAATSIPAVVRSNEQRVYGGPTAPPPGGRRWRGRPESP